MSWYDRQQSGRDQWKRGKGWRILLWTSCQRSLELIQIRTRAAWKEGTVPFGYSSSFNDLSLLESGALQSLLDKTFAQDDQMILNDLSKFFIVPNDEMFFNRQSNW